MGDILSADCSTVKNYRAHTKQSLNSRPYALRPAPCAPCALLSALCSVFSFRQNTGNLLLQFINVDRFETVLGCPQL